jgi:hypothetical protein
MNTYSQTKTIQTTMFLKLTFTSSKKKIAVFEKWDLGVYPLDFFRIVIF